MLALVSIAAEPDAAPVRREAEAQLAAARLRLAEERASLFTRLQQAVAADAAARARLAAVEREAAALAGRIEQLEREQGRSAVAVREAVEQAVPEAQRSALAQRPAAEQVDAAIAAVERRMAALPDRLAQHQADEPVVARDGGIVTVPVLRLGEARAVALGSEDRCRGVLERTADGNAWMVVGPSVPAGAGVIPLDAAGTLAHQPATVQRSLREWLDAGRFFIWPILLVLVVGVGIVVRRAVALARRPVDHRRLVQVAELIGRGDPTAAAQVVAAQATPLDRVLAAGLAARTRPREAREAAVEQALLAETSQLTRGLAAIAVLAGVAPLLGLLGTVTGMIDMFSVIAAQGGGNARSLSGGISEALICTQAGMLVAIPLLVAHAWLSRLADRRAQLLEEAACGVLGLAEEPRP